MTTANNIDIFSESFSRAVVEVAPENAHAFESMIDGLSFEKIGTVGGDKVIINDVSMSLTELKGLYYDTFKQVIERDI